MVFESPKFSDNTFSTSLKELLFKGFIVDPTVSSVVIRLNGLSENATLSDYRDPFTNIVTGRRFSHRVSLSPGSNQIEFSAFSIKEISGQEQSVLVDFFNCTTVFTDISTVSAIPIPVDVSTECFSDGVTVFFSYPLESEVSSFNVYITSDPSVDPSTFKLVASVDSSEGLTVDKEVIDVDSKSTTSTGTLIRTVESHLESHRNFLTRFSLSDSNLYYVVVSAIVESDNTIVESLWSAPVTARQFDLPSASNLSLIPTRQSISEQIVQEISKTQLSGLEIFPGTSVIEFIANPLSLIIARLYAVEDLHDRLRNLSYLVRLDDANNDGVSDSVDSTVKQEFVQKLQISGDALQAAIDAAFDMHAVNHALSRRLASYAVVQATLWFEETPSSDLNIPYGTQVKAPKERSGLSDDLFFETQQSIFIPITEIQQYFNDIAGRYEIFVVLKAVSPGSSYNIPSFALDSVVGSFAVKLSAENSVPVFSGVDRESNIALAKRIFMAAAGINTSSEAWFKAKVLSVQGISDVSIARAGSSYLLRDYDWGRRQHIGGRVDIYASSDSSVKATERYGLNPYLKERFVFDVDGTLICENQAFYIKGIIDKVSRIFSVTRDTDYYVSDPFSYSIIENRIVKIDFSPTSGENFVENPDTEALPVWIPSYGMTKPVVENLAYSLSSDYIFKGIRSLKLTLNSGRQDGWYWVKPFSDSALQNNTPYETGRSYMFGFYYRIPSQNVGASVRIKVVSRILGQDLVLIEQVSSVVDSWQFFGVEFAVPNNSLTIAIGIQLNGLSGESVYLDEFISQRASASSHNSVLGWAPGEACDVYFTATDNKIFLRLDSRPVQSLDSIVTLPPKGEDELDLISKSELEFLSPAFLEGGSVFSQDYVVVDSSDIDVDLPPESKLIRSVADYPITADKSVRIKLPESDIILESLSFQVQSSGSVFNISDLIITQEGRWLYVSLSPEYLSSVQQVKLFAFYDYYLNVEIGYLFDNKIQEAQNAILSDVTISREACIVKRATPVNLSMAGTVILKDPGARVRSDRAIKERVFSYSAGIGLRVVPYQSALLSIINATPNVRNVQVPLTEVRVHDSRQDFFEVPKLSRLEVAGSDVLIYQFDLHLVDLSAPIYVWAARILSRVSSFASMITHPGFFYVEPLVGSTSVRVAFNAYADSSGFQYTPQQVVCSYKMADIEIDIDSFQVPISQRFVLTDLLLSYRGADA